MGDNAVIALVIGAVVIVVVFLLRARFKSLVFTLFGNKVSADTHKPAGPPPAGAHMTNVKARDATVRDETGQVATMTGFEAERDATVTAAGLPKETPHPKKAPPPGP